MKWNSTWIMSLLVTMAPAVPSLGSAAEIVLTADDHDGKDSVWKARYAAGKKSWGIDGTHKPLNGYMWWNSFPGQTGKYKVELGAVTEPDGNSRYRFFIDDNKVHEGRYPYSTGSLNCGSSKLQALHLDMGEHQVQQGAKIKLWGESVYPCGSSHGQYTRYWEIKFTLQDATGNQAPIIDSMTIDPNPSSPQSEVTFSCSAHDPEQDPLTFSWDFGDGASATGTNALHTYTTGGTYQVKLEVEDGHNPPVRRTVDMNVIDPNLVILEAEQMNLDGYTAEGELIATMNTGKATAAFPAGSNDYRVQVMIIKEDDGQPSLEVWNNQTRLARIQYPLGQANRDPETIDLGVFPIQTGDTIQLIGQLDQGAAARVDKLMFSPGQNTPPTIEIREPAQGQIFDHPAAISILARAQDGDGQIAQVAFSANGLSLGEVSQEPYQLVWEPGAVGSYNIQATASDNSGGVAVASVSIEVRSNDIVDGGTDTDTADGGPNPDQSQAGCRSGTSSTSAPAVIWIWLVLILVYAWQNRQPRTVRETRINLRFLGFFVFLALMNSACQVDEILPDPPDGSIELDAGSETDSDPDAGLDEDAGDLDAGLDPDLDTITDAGTDTDPDPCSASDFLGECTSTTGCKSTYATATDCKNSSGGVCYCGTEVCGCLESCIPNCNGKECGDDECDGSCGTCAQGENCENLLCVPCTPNCNDKECGDDGCNGSCGACAADELCDSSQQCVPRPDGQGVFSGELRMWHKITITWDGPDSDEKAQPNPFLDFRLQCRFTGPSGQSLVVPGYYAADGQAAHTSATGGNKWRCHVAPTESGTWTYQVSFRSGDQLAVNDNANAGASAGFMDGDTGSFDVGPTDKTGKDMRAKGLLQYVQGHYLQFAGTKEYFLKQGPDAPENLLAYQDFDGDFKSDGIRDNRIKSWSAHISDWKNGDPTWQNTKGKGLIGAINYLASKGLNAFSFLPMNIDGDDRNVFPYLDYNERYRLDVSRLDQWEIVFAHGTKMGMFLHFKTQETENELLLDGGNLGVQRKLYYRELIARFGHNLALNWNLGEEINDASTAQKKAWADYFWNHDPYQHHIVIHNGANHQDLLGPVDNGGSHLTGFSLQTNQTDFSKVHSRVLDYLNRSSNAGKPWAVACDEPGDASHALRPAGDQGNSWEDGRKNGIWGTFMAGGWGNEWYFGYQHDHSDLSCEDFRSRDGFWDYARYALEFFRQNDIPFWQMKNDNSISSNGNDYCFYKHGEVYLVYLKNGGQTNLNLAGTSGTFEVKWYDPRNGGALQNGSVSTVEANGNRSLGNPPNNTSSDWLALVRKTN